jgi:hypothetical protein
MCTVYKRCDIYPDLNALPPSTPGFQCGSYGMIAGRGVAGSALALAALLAATLLRESSAQL